MRHRVAPGISAMTSERLEYFRRLLIDQLRQHTQHIRDDQAAALDLTDDGVKDSVDMSLMDINKEMALRLGERESQAVADIDQALLRIREGSYGVCARCGQVIDERRLEAVPTARYDAKCQAIIEAENGDDTNPSL
jgi:DnaK suppressor protein